MSVSSDSEVESAWDLKYKSKQIPSSNDDILAKLKLTSAKAEESIANNLARLKPKLMDWNGIQKIENNSSKNLEEARKLLKTVLDTEMEAEEIKQKVAPKQVKGDGSNIAMVMEARHRARKESRKMHEELKSKKKEESSNEIQKKNTKLAAKPKKESNLNWNKIEIEEAIKIANEVATLRKKLPTNNGVELLSNFAQKLLKEDLSVSDKNVLNTISRDIETPSKSEEKNLNIISADIADKSNSREPDTPAYYNNLYVDNLLKKSWYSLRKFYEKLDLLNYQAVRHYKLHLWRNYFVLWKKSQEIVYLMRMQEIRDNQEEIVLNELATKFHFLRKLRKYISYWRLFSARVKSLRNLKTGHKSNRSAMNGLLTKLQHTSIGASVCSDTTSQFDPSKNVDRLVPANIQLMKERAIARANSRLALKQKYDENNKKKQQELEAAALILKEKEETARLVDQEERKKHNLLQEAQKLHNEKILNEKIKLATLHNMRNVLFYYGWRPWRVYIEKCKSKLLKATAFNLRHLKVRIFHNWRKFVINARKAYYFHDSLKLKLALSHDNYRIEKLAFLALKTFCFETKRKMNSIAIDCYFYSLVRTYFSKWKNCYHHFAQLARIIESDKDIIAMNYLPKYLKKHYFRLWKKSILDNRKQIKSNILKESLLSKAKSWINEHRLQKNAISVSFNNTGSIGSPSFEVSPRPIYRKHLSTDRGPVDLSLSKLELNSDVNLSVSSFKFPLGSSISESLNLRNSLVVPRIDSSWKTSTMNSLLDAMQVASSKNPEQS